MLISNFSNRLNETMKIRNITSAEIVRQSEKLYKLGKINKPLTKPLMSNYLKGNYEAKQDNIYALSQILNVDEAWLMGLDIPMEKEERKNIQKRKGVKIPVLGYVRAGIPLEAVEDILDYEEIPSEWTNDGSEYFGLSVKGDSMFPYIIETDVIIFKKQNNCENGEIAVVLVNGDEATIKKIQKDETGITLIPFNPMYTKVHYTNEDIQNKPVTIVGVFKQLIRRNFNT